MGVRGGRGIKTRMCFAGRVPPATFGDFGSLQSHSPRWAKPLSPVPPAGDPQKRFLICRGTGDRKGRPYETEANATGGGGKPPPYMDSASRQAKPPYAVSSFNRAGRSGTGPYEGTASLSGGRLRAAPTSTDDSDCKPRVNLVILHSNCSACGGTPQFLIPNS